MSVHTFMTDREFNQTAIDTTARLVFDRAGEVLSSGCPVHEHVQALAILSSTAVFSSLSNTAVNFYHEILDEENSKNDHMEGWKK